MNQDLCVRHGQEGPNFSYIAQMVEGNLGNFFDVLIKYTSIQLRWHSQKAVIRPYRE